MQLRKPITLLLQCWASQNLVCLSHVPTLQLCLAFLQPRHTAFLQGPSTFSGAVSCDSSCLVLGQIPFITVPEDRECVCDTGTLSAMYTNIVEAESSSSGMLVGIWFMFMAAASFHLV